MDPLRFDRLARTLAGAATRRVALAGALGGALISLVPGLPVAGVGASSRRDKQRRERGAESRDDDGVDAVGGQKKRKKCKSPRKKCGKKCVAIKNDPKNCGACGNRCATGQSCVDGTCTCSGAACTGCCDGVTCQAGTTDQQCGTAGGACTPCAGGSSCQGGVCTCPGGQSFCNGVCVDQATDVNNCGACGNICPGAGQASANVSCQNSSCTFSCREQNFDVDNAPENGCEVLDPQSNHLRGIAANLGSRTCFDTPAGSFSGTIYSDNRIHANPAAVGFDPTVGAATLWYRVTGSGGLGCSNDPAIDFTLTSGTMSGCYKVTIDTPTRTASANVTNGKAVISMASSSYTDGSTIYFRVEKTCPITTGEMATFTASYHL